ncbi:tetratricopeptide repeat protein [bacterium]|nr:tetratricopeptide repeat protein [bacterium]
MTSCVNIPARPRKAGLLCALLASALCAIARADGADDAYEAAKSAFDAAAYSNAAVAFDLFLTAHPEHPQKQKARFLLGRSYYELGAWSNSYIAFGQVKLRDASPYRRAEVYYWLGRACERLADESRAVFFHAQAVAAGPETAFYTPAALALARLHARARNIAAAAVAASNALVAAEGRQVVEALFWLSQAALAGGEAQLAHSSAARGVEAAGSGPALAYLQAALARAELALGMTNSAFTTLDAIATANEPAPVAALAAYYQAQRAIERGDSATAASLFELAARKAEEPTAPDADFMLLLPPGFPAAQALTALGTLEVAAGNDADARRRFAACLERYPSSPAAGEAAVKLAACHVRAGAPGLAEQLLERVAAEPDPDIRAQGRMLQGDIALSRSNLLEAASHYTRAIATSSNAVLSAEARYRLALAQYALGNYDAARQGFEAVVHSPGASAERHEDALIRVAWCWLRAGAPRQAEAAITQVLDAHPTGRYAASAALELGRLAYHQGDFSRAEQLFAGIATNTRDAVRAQQAAYELGWVYSRQGRQNDAVAQFAAFATTFPSSPLSDDVSYYLGETYFNMDDYSHARSTFLRIPEKHPASAYAGPAAYWAGVSAIRLGEPADALSILTQHWERIADTQLLPAALLLKGDALSALGDTADAAQAYRQAMERGSNSYIGIEAAFQYGACALSASNWPQATQVFTQLSADDAPDTKARARVLLGSARLAAQDERGALDAWLGVVYEHRDQQASFDEAVDAAGRLYERLGEPDKAEYLYRLRTDAAARQAAAP